MNPVLRVFLEPHYKMHRGMVVNWHRNESEDTLHYRESGSETWLTAAGSSYEIPHSSITHFRVVLDQLQPDTEFEFRFGDEGGGDVRKFKTWPMRRNRDMKVAMISDMQQNPVNSNTSYKNILGHLRNRNPDLFVFNGDYVNCEGFISSGNTNNWFSILDSFSELVSAEGYHIPIVATVGNHEVTPMALSGSGDHAGEKVHNANYLRLFFHSIWNEDKDGYGQIYAGNYFMLICLDTDHQNTAASQTPWLNELYNKLGNRYTHVLATEHINPYPGHRGFDMSPTPEAYEPSVIVQRGEWHPILQKINTRFIHCGHEHLFTVSPRIQVNSENPQGHVNADAYESIVYTGSGGLGTNLRTVNNAEEWWVEDVSRTANYWIFTLKDGEITASSWNSNNGTLLNEKNQVVKNIAYGKPRLALAA